MGKDPEKQSVSKTEGIIGVILFLGLIGLIGFIARKCPYYTSQKYTSSLKTGEEVKNSGSKTDIASERILPEKIPDTDWKLDGDLEIYPEERLFEKIDGADERYKLYGTKRLVFGSYVGSSNEDTDMDNRLDVFVFEMKTPLAALGIFGCERFRGAINQPELADAGYSLESSTFFRKGKYYVQVKGFSEKVADACGKISRYLAEKLPAEKAPIAAFNFLPKEDLIPGSERFDPKDAILGTDFLENVFSAEYGSPDKPVIIFAINYSKQEDAQAAFIKYSDYLKQQGKVLKLEEINGVTIQMIDLDGLYEGFFLQSGILAGVSEAPDLMTLKKYLEALSKAFKGGVVPQVQKKEQQPVLD